MIKLSVNETKWSCLLARTRAVILYISIWIFDFGFVKLPGLSRNETQSTYQVSRIRVFLNPQLFLSVFEFARPSNKYPDSLQYPGLFWEYWQKSMRQGCHIHGKELGSILLRHRIKKYPDLESTRFRIPSVFKNFHSGEQIQKVADFPSKKAPKLQFVGYQTWKSEKLPNDLEGSTWQTEFLKKLLCREQIRSNSLSELAAQERNFTYKHLTRLHSTNNRIYYTKIDFQVFTTK